MKNRVHNFSAGPATLPLEVLESIKEELINYKDIGSSIIEISHRDKTFVELAEKIEETLRNLLSVPQDYDVLFLQGGATLQFSMIPLNFSYLGDIANYAEIGSWSSKAIKEASKLCDLNICTSSKKNKFTEIDDLNKWDIKSNSSIIHYCKNETIQGIQIKDEPNFESSVFVDMSSCLFSEDIDVSKYDFIYACAQKNFGPAGITLVIAKKELISKSNPELSNILRYDAHASEKSMLNTPNTFGWYAAGKMFDWYTKEGGVKKMEERSIKKSDALYSLIDNSDFYINPVNKAQRSICNVVFTLSNPDLDNKFLEESDAQGLKYLKGHRTVGGMRASIYNSLPMEAVESLVDFMRSFETKYG